MPAVAVEFRLSSILELQRHAQDLMRMHWEEVATRKKLMRLDPDWHRYGALERLGDLFVITAWEEEKGMVGYSVNVASENPHYRGLLTVHNDVLFMHPDFRSGNGKALMDATEQHAAVIARRRCFERATMSWHAKPGTALDRLLAHREGYAVQDIIHMKELGV